MRPFVLSLLLLAALEPAQSRQTFTGSITDSMCSAGDHSKMKMGSNNAECTIACVDSHGAAFILYDGKNVLGLSDQKTAEKFAGENVVISGVLDSAKKTIRVDSITAARK